MIKIKDSTEELTVKNPNPENKPLLVDSVVPGTRQRCMSGDETLVLSGLKNILSKVSKKVLPPSRKNVSLRNRMVKQFFSNLLKS